MRDNKRERTVERAKRKRIMRSDIKRVKQETSSDRGQSKTCFSLAPGLNGLYGLYFRSLLNVPRTFLCFRISKW